MLCVSVFPKHISILARFDRDPYFWTLANLREMYEAECFKGKHF